MMVVGTLKFKIKGFDVDFGAKWEKYDYVSTIAKHTKVNILEASLSEMEKALQKLKIDPALASAVIVTTFTDCCGFAFSLGLATLLLKYLT